MGLRERPGRQECYIVEAGQEPKLPEDYQILIKVKVAGGVPIDISYVTHHVLSVV